MVKKSSLLLQKEDSKYTLIGSRVCDIIVNENLSKSIKSKENKFLTIFLATQVLFMENRQILEQLQRTLLSFTIYKRMICLKQSLTIPMTSNLFVNLKIELC